MHIKRNLIYHKRIFLIQQKTMGIWFYIPIIMNLIIIPLMSWFIYGKWGDSAISYVEILSYMQYFVPLGLAWWILLAFTEYVEGRGKELYYIDKRIKLGNLCCWVLFYLMIVLIPFGFAAALVDDFMIEYVRIVIECILYAGMCYMLLFLTASAAVTLVIILIYTVYCSFGLFDVSPVFIYFLKEPWCEEVFLGKYFYIGMIGCICFIIGRKLNEVFEKY